jgi:3-methyladenine DNA glycosylase/8-oxoguanine DNA glycosylase
MTIQIPARQPFSFHATVRSHGWCQLAPFEYDEGQPLLRYVTRLEGGDVVSLQMREMPGGVLLDCEPELDAAGQEEVTRQVTWMLALDMDLSPFYAAVRHEPRLAQAEQRAQGRVLRSPTLFEDVIKTVLTTNTLWAATRRMNQNLIEQFGQPLTADERRRAFPTPQSIAASDEQTLRTMTRLGYRAPYVLDIARRVASGEVDLEALKTSDLPTAELRKRLLALKGIGGYAAANLLMILGRGDHLTIDSWARKLVSEEWYNGQPVTDKQVEEAFADWGEWKGMAYWFWDWKSQQQAEERPEDGA